VKYYILMYFKRHYFIHYYIIFTEVTLVIILILPLSQLKTVEVIFWWKPLNTFSRIIL